MKQPVQDAGDVQSDVNLHALIFLNQMLIFQDV